MMSRLLALEIIWAFVLEDDVHYYVLVTLCWKGHSDLTVDSWLQYVESQDQIP